MSVDPRNGRGKEGLMIFGNPVRGTIYLSPGVVDGHARWFRSQRFGCTGFSWEPPFGSCAHFHRGVDIARGPAGCNDDLISVGPGLVVYAGTLNGGGKSVIVKHAGGLATGHGHMNGLSVSTGQKVTKGQKLGLIGDTGLATGCHDHLALKTGFNTSVMGPAAANAFWRDPGAAGAVGHFADIWPLLEQNVTIHPKADEGIRIRLQPTTAGAPFATVQGGRIIRTSDDKDLGPVTTPRDWGGAVSGGAYTVAGTTSKVWDRIQLDGAFRFVARPLAVRSAT